MPPGTSRSDWRVYRRTCERATWRGLWWVSSSVVSTRVTWRTSSCSAPWVILVPALDHPRRHFAELHQRAQDGPGHEHRLHARYRNLVRGGDRWLPLAMTLNAVGSPITTALAFAQSTTAFTSALQAGNLQAAATALVGAPANIANGFLNGEATLPLTLPLSATAGIPVTLNIPVGGILAPLRPSWLMRLPQSSGRFPSRSAGRLPVASFPPC